MKLPAFLKGEVGLIAIGAVVVVYLLYKAGKLGAGLVSGNNALTAGTPYAGVGAGVGTLAAGTNAVLGGAPQSIGDSIGETLADWFVPTPLAGNGVAYGTAAPANPIDFGVSNAGGW